MEQKTNYEAPLLSVETASAECGFAASEVQSSGSKIVYATEEDYGTF